METMKKLLQLLPACFDTTNESGQLVTQSGSDRQFRKSSLSICIKDGQDRLVKDMSNFSWGRINAIECKWAKACLEYKAGASCWFEGFTIYGVPLPLRKGRSYVQIKSSKLNLCYFQFSSWIPSTQISVNLWLRFTWL